MQLLIDTDFIIKMGRYQMLGTFEALMVENGHPRPFENLTELGAKIRSAEAVPDRSEFKTLAALRMCWSFNADCKRIGGVTDYDVLQEISDIDGVDAGEALLIERAVHEPETLIVTGDKRMVRGLCTPAADAVRPRIQGRVLLIERVVYSLKPKLGITEIRQRVHDAPDCDAAIYDAMHPNHSESEAWGNFFHMLRNFENTSRGVLRRDIK